MTRQEIITRFPYATESFIQRNITSEDNRTKEDTQPQRHLGDEPHGKVLRTKGDGRRFRIRFAIFRRRLLDIDNLFIAYHTNCLRRCGAIPDDDPATVVAIEISQQKSQEERTEIEVIELNENNEPKDNQ